MSKKANNNTPPSVQDATSFPGLPGVKSVIQTEDKSAWGPKSTPSPAMDVDMEEDEEEQVEEEDEDEE
jgi:hypothetical protein